MCNPSSTCMLGVRESSGLSGQRLWNEWWSDEVGMNPALVRWSVRSLPNAWLACLIP